jgi:enterochelin esterase-like enzyme
MLSNKASLTASIRFLSRWFCFTAMLLALGACIVRSTDDDFAEVQIEQATAINTNQASDEEYKNMAEPTRVVDVSVTPTVQVATRSTCSEPRGRIKRVEYSSRFVGDYIPVLVYLPPCYSEQSEYPAVYLLHGKPQDENHWMILGIDKIADQMIADGELQGVILVMPEQPEPLFSQTDGGSGSYEGEFVKALMPFIEESFAVGRNPEQRAIAGISRGGVWSLEIGFNNPELFAGMAALSPALNVNDARPEYDPLVIAQTTDEFVPRIFLASGDVDSAAGGTQRLHSILTERGVEHRYSTVPGGHEGSTWRQLLAEMLKYLSQDW